MQTDENAFICSGRKFEPNRTICFIGDSFVENKFVDQDSRWFSYLEKLLLDNGFRTQVLNAGYSGATSLNILNTILNKVINTDIDVIYYCISSNDYSTLGYNQTYWNTTKNHSNLLLSEYSESLREDLKPDNFIRMIRSIHDVCYNFDIKIHFMTYPNLCNNMALTYINSLLIDVCQDFNYSLIDTDLLMQPYKINFENLFHDKLHLNEDGSRIFAKILVDNHFLNYINVDSGNEPMITEFYKDLHQNTLLIEFGENYKNTYTAYSLIIDVKNQDVRRDRLLLQLVSDHLDGDTQEGFEFSEEFGWHTFVDIHIHQVQIRYSFILNAVHPWMLRVSLVDTESLDELIANISLECC